VYTVYFRQSSAERPKVGGGLEKEKIFMTGDGCKLKLPSNFPLVAI